MGLQMKRLMSAFPSSRALAIRLDNRADLNPFGSKFIHVSIIFLIGFISAKNKLEPVLTGLRAALIKSHIQKTEDASFI
jgi:hypothetical protein